MSPSPAATSTEPTALRNLLPVGALFLPIFAPAEQEICDHKHAEDGWHEFRAQKFVGLFSRQEDISFCNDVQFLINQGFVRATHQNNANGYVTLRIYLIPDDLPEISGKLRTRPHNLLPAARRRLRVLLPKIITDERLWDGVWFNEPPKQETQALLPGCKDSSRTLAEIYSNISSPQPTPVPGYGEIATRLLNFNDDLEGLGLRSTLYTYQRRSVAAMLQKELDPRSVPDPLFIPLSTVNSKTFYLQPGTMEILLECPSMAPCRGGILCEELGTGKTVMMLGLISATKCEISSPEPSTIESRLILTPLAFRHFPSSNYVAARQQLGVKYRNSILQRKKDRVPSFVELLIHRVRAAPRCDVPRNLTSKAYEHDQHLIDIVSNSEMGKFIHANVPYYHHESKPRGRSERVVPYAGPKVLYLTSATLVIVPANLISQWDREILKHCHGPLRVLILRPKTPLPSVHSLATDYDIIIMPYTRFTSESKHTNVGKLHERRTCTCPEYRSMRVPVCTCAPIEGVSPLLQIRWKRLVIDEGHISSSLTTSLVPFAKMLSVERRWIITGTPTTNLLGLSFGSKTVDDTRATDVPLEDHTSETTSAVSTPQSSPGRKSVETHTPAQLADQPSANRDANFRQWNRWDRQDLNKLGNMIAHFICVPQFQANPKLIPTHIVEPLLDTTGPRGGSVDVLRQVMEMVMIRHRIEDVEKDVVLPPITQESVLLDLDPLVIKSFNALQAIILINAVDSQRKDRDYMFHPQNADHLAETVQNMSQILFWRVDGDKYYAETLVPEAQAVIQNAIDRKMSDSDIEGLKAAFHHLKIALDDPLWVQIQAHEAVPYRVFDLQHEILKTWTRTTSTEFNGSDRQTGMVHADRLLCMHGLILKKPLMGVKAIAESGEHHLDMFDRTQRDAYKNAAAKQDKRRSHPHPLKNSNSDAASAKPLANEFSNQALLDETLQEVQGDLSESLKKMELEEMDNGASDANVEEHHGAVAGSAASGPSSRPILASSQLAKMRIGASASTKINFIINDVKKYSKDEKFLIFSASPLSLAHVAEALELIHVKFLQFTTQIPAHLREQLVLTFETSETYRVFLMELKHGARGLNLTSASRVIFCEPVWQADVESQAIKRVHRIGQKRPINVKTLAIRDTAEEHMLYRRSALRKGSQGKIPTLLEEKGMRDYIQNPTFITRPPKPTPVAEFPLLDLPPELLQACPGAIIPNVPPLCPPPIKRSGPPCDKSEEPEQKKKKLSVTFA